MKLGPPLEREKKQQEYTSKEGDKLLVMYDSSREKQKRVIKLWLKSGYIYYSKKNKSIIAFLLHLNIHVNLYTYTGI